MGDGSNHLRTDLGDMPWLRRAETQAVFRALIDAGFDTRAVGGAVRNSLIGKPVTDIDIATTAEPDAIVAAARAAGLAAVPTGIDHGTITVISNHVPHEVTTLRQDVSTDGRRATVVFTTDWSRDAARRDFTINALYCDHQGKVFDPLGGLADLAARNVRFIGNPTDRIREDYLRILRFFRFSATYASGNLDTVGLTACDQERDGLRRLSAERIQAELAKLLLAPSCVSVIHAMHRHGYWPNLLGTVPAPNRFARYLELETALALPPAAISRLAALAVHTRESVRVLSNRLRLSRAEAHRLQIAASGLETKTRFVRTEAELKKSLYYRGPESYQLSRLFAWLGTDTPVADTMARETLSLSRRWHPPTLPLTGADVLALGVPPGPAVGRLIAELEAWWIDGEFTADRPQCLAKLREIAAAG